jgi:hypothetical protein
MTTPGNFAIKITMLSVVFLFLFPNFAKAITLSDNSHISLLTASPGDELYSVFGHSALRVVDQQNNLDLVFNYGTFDFDTPNFYTNFVRGKLLYKLSVAPMQYFVPEYQYEGRALFEQVLDLSAEQKQLMFDYLVHNSQPENAYYHYDFFYDNCATRIRDLIEVILEPQWPGADDFTEGNLAHIRSLLDYEYDYRPQFAPDRTLRDMLQPFLVTMPWSAFGIDLALGLPADRIATPWDYQYLPDEMLIAFALARHPDGRPIVSHHRIIMNKTVELTPASPITPALVTWALFILAMVSLLNRKWSVLFDKVYFSILGVLGIVIVFLWFFTDHLTTKTNLNLLWALPTHLWFIWQINNNDPDRGMRKWYFRMVTILSALLLLFFYWIPQAFHPAFFPLILIVFVKSFLYAFDTPFISRLLKRNS